MNSFLSKKRNLYFLIVLALIAESFTAIFLKFGGRHPFLSGMYLLWLGAAVGVLAFYAVVWQLVLERIPLSTAYLRKGISYMLVFLWANVIFHETITLKQYIGIALIIIGMVVSMTDEH